MFLVTILSMIFCSVMFCGAYEIPSDGLQIRLAADSIKSTTDFFVSAMPNLSNTRYGANQTQIQHRPLYMKSFVEHRPVVSLSDMRGFAFGTFMAARETTAYIGYYEQSDRYKNEFGIIKLSSDDILAKRQKSGFVLGVYDGMLALHGVAGYTAAFTEFLIYSKIPTPDQDAQIRNYLNSRYRIRSDKRHLRASPLITADNLLYVSNAVGFDDRTLICAALIEDTQRRTRKLSLELFRSYNQGDKWLPAIGSILENDQVLPDIEPFVYVNIEKTTYLFYCKSAETGGFGIALRYSDQGGYRWSEEFLVEEASSNKKMKVVNKLALGQDVVFVIRRQSQPPFLLKAENILFAKTFAEIDWKVYELPFVDFNAYNHSFTVYDEKIYCIYNRDDGSMWQMFTEAIGGAWSEAKKITSGGFALYNPIEREPVVCAYSDGMVILFRNTRSGGDADKDTLWFTKSDMKDDAADWSSPQIAVYSREFGKDGVMNINSVDVFDNGLKASITCGGAAYFSAVDVAAKTADILPQGIGVLELKGKFDVKANYDIPPLPSLFRSDVVFEIETAGNMSDGNKLLFRIGDRRLGLAFFIKNRYFGVWIGDGENEVVAKSGILKQGQEQNIIIELDGKADIIRIIVDGNMGSPADEEKAQSWAYLPQKIENLAGLQLIEMPDDAHGFINRLSLHYKTDSNFAKGF